MPYKNRSFEHFLKNLSRKIPIFMYPGLQYAHKNLMFACKSIFLKSFYDYKIRFAVEEKKTRTSLGQFQNYFIKKG